ncbi:MAG: prepilin-type N-terminal cleavage/methylation domain-containing protein [Planctomycetota bacterium]|jgi:prepilin-type N-terminal cleavage/methylation domain-containing protein
MKIKAFTLVEILIVVAVFGILAAIVIPTLKGHTATGRESSVKESLNTIRTQIEFYKMDHDGVPPGYVNGEGVPESYLPLHFTGTTMVTGEASPDKIPSDPFLYGPYIKKLPINPYNNLSTIIYVDKATAFADAVDGTSSGWLYKKETGEFKINWPGTDSEGVNFYDY